MVSIEFGRSPLLGKHTDALPVPLARRKSFKIGRKRERENKKIKVRKPPVRNSILVKKGTKPQQVELVAEKIGTYFSICYETKQNEGEKKEGENIGQSKEREELLGDRKKGKQKQKLKGRKKRGKKKG